MSEEPNLFIKAANFAKAAVKHVSQGMPKVSEDVLKQRLDVCDACPEVNKDKPNWTCTKCGCNLKIKASWASQDCPLKKWPVNT